MNKKEYRRYVKLIRLAFSTIWIIYPHVSKPLQKSLCASLQDLLDEFREKWGDRKWVYRIYQKKLNCWKNYYLPKGEE